MRRLLIVVGCLLGWNAIGFAQDSGLVAHDTTLVTRLDAFGQQTLVAEGQIVNQSGAAYANVNLTADAYDANDQQVGEGFGFLVNACGGALPPDFQLQPGRQQRFAIALETDDVDAEISRVEVSVQGEGVPPNAPTPTFSGKAITAVVSDEVVSVEWIDAQTLRFGAGCAQDVFTTLKWYEYDLPAQRIREAVHPKAAQVTDALREQLGLTDPNLFDHSYLGFAPNARRMVYQNGHSDLITAEPDGSFKRVLDDKLFKHSLQGILWLDEGRFLAYYYGAYGEPVLYFTASVDGQPISASLENSLPSVIIPGATPDGLRAVIGGTFDGKTGYFLKGTTTQTNELLFESDLPGNNFPAPVYIVPETGKSIIYVARPVNGQAELDCYDPVDHQVHSLTPLPLNLRTDEQAWMWIAPDQNTLALAANGMNGGLWLVDLGAFAAC
jgi:hypothetical protein